MRTLNVRAAWFAIVATALSSAWSEEVPYGVAKSRWVEALGNHRARVQVKQKAEAVRVHLPWRRRDPEPQKKHIIVVDVATGKGAVEVVEVGDDRVVVRAYSGARNLKAGEEHEFRFALMITPFKPLDSAHWNQRYYHYYKTVVPVDKVAATGATIINCHQANRLNPYINYPFLTTDAMTAYVKRAHIKGIKVKTYYTVRELSNFVVEMWPLRSLRNEVFKDGSGQTGHSWLREHLVKHYSPAWHAMLSNGEVDASIATVGLSRWHNYGSSHK